MAKVGHDAAAIVDSNGGDGGVSVGDEISETGEKLTAAVSSSTRPSPDPSNSLLPLLFIALGVGFFVANLPSITQCVCFENMCAEPKHQLHGSVAQRMTTFTRLAGDGPSRAKLASGASDEVDNEVGIELDEKTICTADSTKRKKASIGARLLSIKKLARPLRRERKNRQKKIHNTDVASDMYIRAADGQVGGQNDFQAGVIAVEEEPRGKLWL